MTVVVVSRDRRFLRVTGFLLRRRGVSVVATERRAEAMRALAGAGADAVVVDAEGSPAEAAAWRRAVRTLHPDVAVVIAAEPPGSAASEAVVVGKWRPVEELVAALEKALWKTR
jgi:DNA-binding NtrC family response regulator